MFKGWRIQIKMDMVNFFRDDIYIYSGKAKWMAPILLYGKVYIYNMKRWRIFLLKRKVAWHAFLKTMANIYTPYHIYIQKIIYQIAIYLL